MPQGPSGPAPRGSAGLELRKLKRPDANAHLTDPLNLFGDAPDDAPDDAPKSSGHVEELAASSSWPSVTSTRKPIFIRGSTMRLIEPNPVYRTEYEEEPPSSLPAPSPKAEPDHAEAESDHDEGGATQKSKKEFTPHLDDEEEAAARDPVTSESDDDELDHQQRMLRRRHLEDAAITLGQDEVPRYETEKAIVCDEQLTRWWSWQTRNCDFSWWEHKVYVKISSDSGNCKVTQWNSKCVKTIYLRNDVTNADAQIGEGKHVFTLWHKHSDRIDINEDVRFGQRYNVIIIVHGDKMIMPHNKSPPRSHPGVAAAKRRHFNRKKKAGVPGFCLSCLRGRHRNVATFPLASCQSGGGGDPVRFVRRLLC